MPVDKSSREVRAMFSSIAPRYDLLNHLLSINQDKRWRRRAIKLLCPRRGELVLDLCCGTGDLAIECRRQQTACRIVGVDFALPMLQRAAEKASLGAGAKDIHLAAGDALHLGFSAYTFDVAMVAFGVRNFENTGAGLREVRRVLKPGGRLLVLEFTRPTSALMRHGAGLFTQHVLPLIGRSVSRHNEAYSYLPASVDDFYSRREFEELLRRCGYTDVRSFDYSAGIATAFMAHKR